MGLFRAPFSFPSNVTLKYIRYLCSLNNNYLFFWPHTLQGGFGGGGGFALALSSHTLQGGFGGGGALGLQGGLPAVPLADDAATATVALVLPLDTLVELDDADAAALTPPEMTAPALTADCLTPTTVGLRMSPATAAPVARVFFAYSRPCVPVCTTTPAPVFTTDPVSATTVPTPATLLLTPVARLDPCTTVVFLATSTDCTPEIVGVVCTRVPPPTPTVDCLTMTSFSSFCV
uniref:Uncharacterized protein n=1 Tax=Cacopsylla melanoneura TaxID=428564 RepID=A0A8D8Y7J3_9HEMI